MKKKEIINRSGKNKWVVGLFLFFFPFLCYPNLSSASPEEEAKAVWQNTDKKVTLKMTGKTLAHILSGIKAQTGLSYGFRDTPDAARNGLYSIDVKNVSVEEALNTLLKGTEFTYTIESGWILIRTRQEQLSRSGAVHNRVTVKGRVVDEKGQPMPGVTVRLKGTGIGAVTGVEGEYRLDFPEVENVALVFSFVGMKTQEVKYTGQPELNIVMQEDVAQMEEVVVTGYQTISKERATGAYTIIDTKALEQKPTANISSALNGLVPGLAVQSSPVEGTTRFVIRGQGTLQNDQADVDPLIVVDGFPISGYSDDNDPFSSINPNDVESITVLKDAAATSIYGARAANGVIVITTKKGKAGNKLDISADAYWSVSSRADLDYAFNMASAENQFRYIELYHKYNPITLTRDPYATALNHKQSYFMSKAYTLLYEKDTKGHLSDEEYNSEKRKMIEMGNRALWKDDLNEYIFRHAFRSQYNVALRGMTDRMNYAFSASYDDEKGYAEGNDNQRVMLNMTTSARLTKNLTFDIALNSSFSKRHDNGATLSSLQQIISPWSRLVDDDGNFIHVPTSSTVYTPVLESVYNGKTSADWHYNPAEDRQYTDNKTQTMNYRVQGGLGYKTQWGLNVSAKGQYEWRRYTNRNSYDPESFFVRDLYNTYSSLNTTTNLYETYFPVGGIFTDAGNVYEAYNLRGQADYTLNRDRHVLTLLAGTEILSSTIETTPAITRYGYNRFTNSVYTQPDYMTDYVTIFGQTTKMPFEPLGTLSTWEDRFFSVYANVGYTYDDKYSLTASFRTDASNFQSKSQRDKFSPFWSVGAGWLISKESFMTNANAVDMLKLRTSFGIAGVAAGKRGTSSVTTLATHPGDARFTNEAYNSISARGNETLTWEKSRTFNLGMDASLWNNKLSGSIEFYNKYSFDVLSNATVPVISQGVNQTVFNNAEVLNRGVELTLSSNLRIVDDLKWQGTLNYAFNHNEVKEYYLNSPVYPSSYGFVKGYPVDAVFAFKLAGYTPEGYVVMQGKDGSQNTILDQETDFSSKNIARDELKDNNWFYYLGSGTPKSNLSFTNRFTWKGVTFSFMITGRFGYYVTRNDLLSESLFNASFSKQLDKSFAVYDEGYANQTGYTALPLWNDDNYLQYKNSINVYAWQTVRMSESNCIKGDHIRLNEIFLGYDLPENLLSRQGVFSRINIYAQASNLGLIWSKNGEMDPDYRIGTIKPMPTFTFGLKLGFKNWK